MKKISLILAASFFAMPLLAQANDEHLRKSYTAEQWELHENLMKIREQGLVHGEYSQEINPNRKYFPKYNFKTLNQDGLDSKHSDLNDDLEETSAQSTNRDSNIMEVSDADKIKIQEQAIKYRDERNVEEPSGRSLPDTQTKEEIQSEGDEEL